MASPRRMRQLVDATRGVEIRLAATIGIMPQPFSDFSTYSANYARILATIAERAPHAARHSVVHGSAVASVLHLRHRMSWDLDLTGRNEHAPLDEVANALSKAFPHELRWDVKDEVDLMFHGHLRLPGLPAINIDLLRNVHDGMEWVFEKDPRMKGFESVTLETYFVEKADSVGSRREAKDLHDLAAGVGHTDSAIQKLAKRAIINGGVQLAVMLRERLGSGLERFAPLRPKGEGFSPVSTECLEALRAFADDRYLRHKLIDNARRMDRRMSFDR